MHVNIVGSICFLVCVDPPKVTVSSDPVVVVEGNNVTLVCNATGMPPPSIEWTKDIEPENVLSNTSTLTLDNVRRPGNADNTIKYQCRAKNGFGNPDSSMVTVVVHCEYCA